MLSVKHYKTTVGNVTQWLGHRSLASGLSLIFVSVSMVYMWPLSGYSVRYGSTNQANSAFYRSGVGKWVVIHIIPWITGVETIRRRPGCIAVWLQVKVCGHRPIDCSLCLWHQSDHWSWVCGLWYYISATTLPLPYLNHRAGQGKSACQGPCSK